MVSVLSSLNFFYCHALTSPFRFEVEKPDLSEGALPDAKIKEIVWQSMQFPNVGEPGSEGVPAHHLGKSIGMVT
jgi:hypothetical protein